MERPFDLVEFLHEFYQLQARVTDAEERIARLERLSVEEQRQLKSTNISEPGLPNTHSRRRQG